MIPRREFLSCGLAAATAASALQTAGEGRFNVLFVAVDDLRPELGCYGNNLIRTPNVDRLAQRGLLFRRACCQAAVCGPSRASLPTGLRPDTTKVWGNRTHFRKTLPDLVTLPQAFKGAGYHAEAIGKVLHGNTADPPSWSVPAWPPGGRQAGMQYVDEDAFREMRAAEPKRAWRGEEIPTLEWKKLHSWQALDVPDNALQDGQVANRAVEALRRVRDRRFFLAVGFQNSRTNESSLQRMQRSAQARACTTRGHLMRPSDETLPSIPARFNGRPVPRDPKNPRIKGLRGCTSNPTGKSVRAQADWFLAVKRAAVARRALQTLPDPGQCVATPPAATGRVGSAPRNRDRSPMDGLLLLGSGAFD